MYKLKLGIILVIILLLVPTDSFSEQRQEEVIKLPPPRLSGAVSVEEAIFKRKSVRSYKPGALTSNEISQLLWAGAGATCDGITGATRAYPSAGASYPLEAYLLAGEIEGLAPGVYRYNYREHALILIKPGDLRKELTTAGLGQRMVEEAPVSLIFTTLCARTTQRYGERGERYASMDAGHAGQNIHLEAEAMGLGTVVVGAFDSEAVKNILGLGEEEPLYIMPVGKKE